MDGAQSKFESSESANNFLQKQEEFFFFLHILRSLFFGGRLFAGSFPERGRLFKTK